MPNFKIGNAHHIRAETKLRWSRRQEAGGGRQQAGDGKWNVERTSGSQHDRNIAREGKGAPMCLWQDQKRKQICESYNLRLESRKYKNGLQFSRLIDSRAWQLALALSWLWPESCSAGVAYSRLQIYPDNNQDGAQWELVSCSYNTPISDRLTK